MGEWRERRGGIQMCSHMTLRIKNKILCQIMVNLSFITCANVAKLFNLRAAVSSSAKWKIKWPTDED